MSIGDSLIGATLAGRYRIEARVGSGAMGAVYRAEQAGLGRRVALKILNRDRSVGGDTVQRFRREAQALSALHHVNTVRVFDFGATDEGLLFLTMELLEGEPLTDCIVREGPLPVHQAVNIIQQVLRSIGEAHAQGIVHRDLKPDNVFLARVPSQSEPMVKVLDFGIAKATDGERTIDQFETLDGTVFGTPRYMSPEQAGGRALDARSDLYSVGIMLYELIAGRPPFVDSDAVVVMARHIREEPLPVCRVAPQRPIPASLEAIVTRALSKSPADRFQSAESFDQALQACLPAAARLARLARSGLHKSLLARIWLAPKRTVWWASGLTATALVLAGLTASLVGSSNPHESLAAVDHRGLQASDTARGGTSRERHVVSLQTEPTAASVFQDGAELGLTPLDVSMNAGSTLTLLLRKRGFAEHTLELHAEDRMRVVTLRPMRPVTDRADKAERTDKADHTPSSWRSRREREHARKASSPEATPAVSPATPSPDKGSPYEKF